MLQQLQLAALFSTQRTAVVRFILRGKGVVKDSAAVADGCHVSWEMV